MCFEHSQWKQLDEQRRRALLELQKRQAEMDLERARLETTELDESEWVTPTEPARAPEKVPV